MIKSVLFSILALSLTPAFAQSDLQPAEVYEAEVGTTDIEPMTRRGFVCFAENRRRQLFRAFGRNPRRVQRRAMNQCFRYSYQCRPLGCRRAWY